MKVFVPAVVLASLSAALVSAQEPLLDKLKALSVAESCELDTSPLTNADSDAVFYLATDLGDAAVAWCHKPHTTPTGNVIRDYELLVLTIGTKHPWSDCPSTTNTPFSYDPDIGIRQPLFSKEFLPEITLDRFSPIDPAGSEKDVPALPSSRPTGPGVTSLSATQDSGAFLYCFSGSWYYWGFH